MWTCVFAQLEILSWFTPLMNAGAATVMAAAFVWKLTQDPHVERERHDREMQRDAAQDVREEKRWNWHEREITSITQSVDTLRISVDKLADKVAELPCKNHAGPVNLSLPASSLQRPAGSPPLSASASAS